MTDTLALLSVEILILIAPFDSADADTSTMLMAESIVIRAPLDKFAPANTFARPVVEVVVWSAFPDNTSSDAPTFCPAPVIMWRSTFIVVWATADAFALLVIEFLVVVTSTLYAFLWRVVASTFSKLEENN